AGMGEDGRAIHRPLCSLNRMPGRALAGMMRKTGMVLSRPDDDLKADSGVEDEASQNNQKQNRSGERSPLIFGAPWVGSLLYIPRGVIARRSLHAARWRLFSSPGRPESKQLRVAHATEWVTEWPL